jgi:hypothetical protein
MAGKPMSTFLAYLRRLLVIAFGFGAASLCSALFFFLGTLLPEYRQDIAGATQTEIVMTSFFYSIVLLPLFATLIGLPVLFLAILAEIFRIRSLLAHGATGMVLGGVAPLIGLDNFENASSELLVAAAAAGIVGGLVYWFVAGRNAGVLIDRIANERAGAVAPNVNGSGPSKP